MIAANSPTFFSRLSIERSKSYDTASADTSDNEAESSDAGVRRATSLRTTRYDGLSFTAAGANLSPNLPLASRHALFSHHRVATSPAPIPIATPPSPTLSQSSSAFSPASAFLSRFSSNTSLRPAPSSATPDGPGAIVLGYTLGKVLGRGGFSVVRLATHANGEQYACKIVKRDDLSDRSGSLEKFEEEIRILQSLPRHPSLLPLLEMERTEFATFLITPVHLAGTLLDVLRREGGSDRTARKWFPGVVEAVAAMHNGYEGFKGGMVHGDLKLDNFLVDHDGKVVACDFYMAQIIDTTPVPPPRRPRATLPAQLEPIGLPAHYPSASLPYAPPELLSHPPQTPSLAQDIWALGVVLYALLTGKLPFVDAFDPRLQMKILRGQWDIPDHLGKEWVEVLQGCLDGNRCTRWTIDRIQQSDAVSGWKEVKQRSKSRSRSRRRDDWADPLTSRPREGRSMSRGGARIREEEFDLHTRGRSPHPIPGLPFAREPRPTSTTRAPSANSRSGSTNRQSSLSHSPTSLGEGQRSRSRTPWGEGTLGVVNEEGFERGRRGKR